MVLPETLQARVCPCGVSLYIDEDSKKRTALVLVSVPGLILDSLPAGHVSPYKPTVALLSQDGGHSDKMRVKLGNNQHLRLW